MSDLRDSKYQMAEYRISIYGRCVAARLPATEITTDALASNYFHNVLL